MGCTMATFLTILLSFDSIKFKTFESPAALRAASASRIRT